MSEPLLILRKRPVADTVTVAAESALRNWRHGRAGDLHAAFRAAVEAGIKIGKQTSLPATSALTARQRDLTLFIEDYVARHGIAPSYDEMAAGIGLSSKNGIARLVLGLEKRGVLERVKGRSRGINLVASARQLEVA